MNFVALRHQKLFRKILSYFICVLSAVLVVSAILYWYFAAELERTAAQRLQLNLNSAVQTIDYSLTAVQNATVGLAESPVVKRLLKPDERLTLAERAELTSISSAITDNLRLTNGMTDKMFLYIDDHRVFVSEGADDFDSFFEKFYRIEGLGGDFWRGLPRSATTFGILPPTTVYKANHGVARVMPIVSISQINGMNAVTASMYSMDKTAQQLKKGVAYDAARCVVFNRQGEPILGDDTGLFDEGTLSRIRFALQDKPYAALRVQGEKFIAISCRSENFGWEYICAVPFLHLGSETANLGFVLALSCGVMLLVGSAVSILFAYRVYSPLHSIHNIIQSSGAARLPENGGASEFQMLATGLKSVLSHYSERTKSITAQYLENGFKTLLQTGGISNINTFGKVLFEAIDYSGGELSCAAIVMNYTDALYREMQPAVEPLSTGVGWIIQMLASEKLKAYTIAYTKEIYVVTAAITGSADRDILMRQLNLLFEALKYDAAFCRPAIGVGEPVESVARLPHSFNQAMQAAQWAQTQESGVVEYSSEQENGDSYSYTENDENKLINCLSAGDIVRFGEVLEQIVDKNEARGLPIWHMELLYDEIFTTGLRFLARRNADPREAGGEKRRMLARIRESGYRKKDAMRFIMEYFQSIFAFNPVVKKERGGSLIMIIKSYVDANFRDPGVCLEKISADIGVSSKYVSRLFKEKTGQNLSDYLTQLRLHEAKRLLGDSGLTLEEISVKVGIESRSTFMRLFKKHEGVTPGAWRESHADSKKPTAQGVSDDD